MLLATDDGPEIWRSRARELFGAGTGIVEVELAEYVDEQRGIYRAAAFVAGALTGCLFVGPAEAAPQWDAVKALFEVETLDDEARRVLLSGRSADGLASAGPIVCACFGVGLAAIRDAIHVRRRHQRRGHRQGAARRHQLRLLPAGAQADRRGHRCCGGIGCDDGARQDARRLDWVRLCHLHFEL